MQKAVIAILGGGNMGASLLGGLIANGYPRENLWVTDPDEKKLRHFSDQFKVQTTSDNQKAVKQADIVILAVKPQVLVGLLTDLNTDFQRTKPLIVSIAAGIRVDLIQKIVGKEMPIVRAMPNTPALISCGATALYANAFVTEEQRDLAESLLRAVGLTVWIDQEKQMDVVTALSGSGPAYFFLVIEALADAAIELGLSEEIAKLLTVQTAYGASRMALESSQGVIELRKKVTSPGGTTEAAVKVLEEHLLREVLKNTLAAAIKRSEELAESMNH